MRNVVSVKAIELGVKRSFLFQFLEFVQTRARKDNLEWDEYWVFEPDTVRKKKQSTDSKDFVLMDFVLCKDAVGNTNQTDGTKEFEEDVHTIVV